eukprot:jgi/Tetstr1/457399/TSEL_044001.t1
MAELSDKERSVYLAKLAEQAERYDEMVDEMKLVAQHASRTASLSVEERNLLSVAYKNVIGARRASGGIVSSIERRRESTGHTANIAMIKSISPRQLSKTSSLTRLPRTSLSQTWLLLHPIRLDLTLNFSVFYYEILNSPERACTSRSSFSVTDLTLWTSDMQDSTEDKAESLRDAGGDA